MRIAHIALHTSPLAQPGSYKAGGMNVYIRELARELGGLGIGIDIFTRRVSADQPAVVPLDAGVRVIHLTSAPADADNTTLVARSAVIADEIDTWSRDAGVSYDVVHAHYWASGPTGALLAERWASPLAVMFHTLAEAKSLARPAEREPDSRIAVERTTAAAADRIVCASEPEAAMLERSYAVPPNRIAVIPCGVDLDRFEPTSRAAARLALGLALDEPIVLFVGRIEPLKGIDLLIDALSYVEPLGTGGPATLLIVGGDALAQREVEDLRHRAARTGVADRVRFVGSAPREMLPLFYSAADVCVVPSHYESFGLVAVEAMACGTPVVASRVGGLTTTVQDGVTGYLVPWRCPEPFAERIELLLANPYLRDSLGRAARRSVERLRWGHIAERVLALYRELAGAVAPGRA